MNGLAFTLGFEDTDKTRCGYGQRCAMHVDPEHWRTDIAAGYGSDAHHTLDRDIGERIRKHRQDRRLGYGQLGGMLGFSGQQMRKYERGLSRIPASTLYVIAHILDVPVNYLLPDEKRMLNPIQQRIQEITTKLSYIEDVRFLVAVSIFISAAANYSQTGRLR